MQCKILNRVKEKREDVLRIAAAHGASNVRVFGPVAQVKRNLKATLTSWWTWSTLPSVWSPHDQLLRTCPDLEG